MFTKNNIIIRNILIIISIIMINIIQYIVLMTDNILAEFFYSLTPLQYVMIIPYQNITIGRYFGKYDKLPKILRRLYEIFLGVLGVLPCIFVWKSKEFFGEGFFWGRDHTRFLIYTIIVSYLFTIFLDKLKEERDNKKKQDMK